MMSKMKDLDSYIKRHSSTEQKLLQELRELIRTTTKGEECISYSMPAFRYHGKIVACFRMYAHHLGFYPYSGGILKQFLPQLKKYKTSTGAVQLPKDKKLPKTLIQKILKARMKEIKQQLHG